MLNDSRVGTFIISFYLDAVYGTYFTFSSLFPEDLSPFSKESASTLSIFLFSKSLIKSFSFPFSTSSSFYFTELTFSFSLLSSTYLLSGLSSVFRKGISIETSSATKLLSFFDFFSLVYFSSIKDSVFFFEDL